MAQIYPTTTHRGTQTPDYAVERVLGDGMEVRRYPAMRMAAVTVEGTKAEAASKAFRKLAGFIFGANSEGRKMAMTTPVITKPATMIQYRGEPVAAEVPEASRTWTQAFILPAEYALGDLPAPDDGTIRVFSTRPYRVAAARFQGAGTPAQYAKARQDLAAVLAAEGIEYAPVPEYAGYDAPWVEPTQKRHEVHFRLAD